MKEFGLIPWKWSRYLVSFIQTIQAFSLQMRHLRVSTWRYAGSHHFQNIHFPVMLSIHELTTNPLKHAFCNNQKGERRFGYNTNSADEYYTPSDRDNTIGISDRVDTTYPKSFGMSLLPGLSKELKDTIPAIKENDTHYHFISIRRT